MNTATENNYNDLMMNSRVNIRTMEYRTVEYDFAVTPEIMKAFEDWKLEYTELTDSLPSNEEVLEWFKSLNVNRCSGKKASTITAFPPKLF